MLTEPQADPAANAPSVGKIGCGLPEMTTRLCCVDTHGAVDVLQPLLTKIGELDCDFASNLIVRGRGETDATRLSDPLMSCGDVDTVSENVIALDEDVTEVDPDPKQLRRSSGTPWLRSRLHSDCAFGRIDHRGKLKQHAVPRGLREAAAMFCHEVINDHAVFAEGAGGAHLIDAHQPGITRDIGRQDCR